MPIQLDEQHGGNLLAVHITGKLVKADYEHFVPEFERLFREHGKLCVLFDMTGFHGWDAGALWEDAGCNRTGRRGEYTAAMERK